MNIQPSMARLAFVTIDLSLLDICNGSCNTDEDSFDIICLPNKIEDINLKLFNMAKEINQPKTLVLMQMWI